MPQNTTFTKNNSKARALNSNWIEASTKPSIFNQMLKKIEMSNLKNDHFSWCPRAALETYAVRMFETPALNPWYTPLCIKNRRLAIMMQFFTKWSFKKQINFPSVLLQAENPLENLSYRYKNWFLSGKNFN